VQVFAYAGGFSSIHSARVGERGGKVGAICGPEIRVPRKRPSSRPIR